MDNSSRRERVYKMDDNKLDVKKEKGGGKGRKKRDQKWSLLPKGCSTRYSLPHSRYCSLEMECCANSGERENRAMPNQGNSRIPPPPHNAGSPARNICNGDPVGNTGRIAFHSRTSKFGNRVCPPHRYICCSQSYFILFYFIGR